MITINENKNNINISVKADIINSSSQLFDLEALRKCIINDFGKIYNSTVGKYTLAISTEIKILTKVNQCSPKRILFQIVDDIRGNNPAEADFKGLRVKLNKNVIHDFILSKNSRTLPHELGHLFGWDHPHANAKFESVNLSAHVLEKNLTETERQCNLMSQSWYAQKAGIPLSDAIQLTQNQIELLLHYYNFGELNKNRHLKYFLWWRKIL